MLHKDFVTSHQVSDNGTPALHTLTCSLQDRPHQPRIKRSTAISKAHDTPTPNTELTLPSPNAIPDSMPDIQANKNEIHILGNFFVLEPSSDELGKSILPTIRSILPHIQALRSEEYEQ